MSGYELAASRRIGRKSLGGSQGAFPRVNFRMTAELQSRAQARADEEGKTVSQIAREALERYMTWVRQSERKRFVSTGTAPTP